MKSKALIGLVAGATIGTAIAMPIAGTSQNNMQSVSKVLKVKSNTDSTMKTNEAVVINGNDQMSLYSNSTGTKVSSYLSTGEMLTILSRGTSYCKVRVQETGAVGYINIANMQDIINGTNEPLTPLSGNGQVINVTTRLRVRSNPSIGSNIIGYLKNEAQVIILGKQGQWYKVSSNGQTGFVYEEYIVSSTVGSNGIGGESLNIDGLNSGTSNSSEINTEGLNGGISGNITNNINSSANDINNNIIKAESYAGTWIPTKEAGWNEDFTSNVKLTSSQLANNKLILTKNLYSFNGITIEDPEYHMVTMNKYDFFGNMNFGGYTYKGIGKDLSFIVATPSGEKFNPLEEGETNLTKYPFISSGNVFAFIGKRKDIYEFNNEATGKPASFSLESNSISAEPVYSATIKNNCTLESQPVSSSEISKSKVKLKLGEKVTVSTNRAGLPSGWVVVTTQNGEVGYVQESNLNIPQNAEASLTVNIAPKLNGIVGGVDNSTYVDFRSLPSINGDIIGHFSTGTSLMVLGENNGWYKVEFFNSQMIPTIGYVEMNNVILG